MWQIVIGTAERRDQISIGVKTESGTSLCTQQNDNRFDRATHRERAEETTTSVTRGSVAITLDN
jgi:hypothetical protein